MSVAELLKIVHGLSTGDRKALATIATRMKQRLTVARRRKLTVAMLKPVPAGKFAPSRRSPAILRKDSLKAAIFLHRHLVRARNKQLRPAVSEPRS